MGLPCGRVSLEEGTSHTVIIRKPMTGPMAGKGGPGGQRVGQRTVLKEELWVTYGESRGLEVDTHQELELNFKALSIACLTSAWPPFILSGL